MCTLSQGLQNDFGSFLRNASCCEGIPDNLHARRVSFLGSGCAFSRLKGRSSVLGPFGRVTGKSIKRSGEPNLSVPLWHNDLYPGSGPVRYSEVNCLVGKKEERQKNIVPSNQERKHQ